MKRGVFLDPILVCLIDFSLLFTLLGLGTPIGATLAIAGFTGIYLLSGPVVALTVMGRSVFSFVNEYFLVVVPLFILMGNLAWAAGISRGMYDAAFKWLSRLPGGLALTTVATCAGFAAVTGSSVATVATIGAVTLPEMKRHGYDDKLAVGCVAASGTLGVLIPPSVIGVIYAVIIECSVSRMLIAGILPGVLSALIYLVMIVVRVKLKPSLAPVSAISVNWRSRFTSLNGAWPAFLLFLLVIGGIYSGITTATEAGALGAFAATVMCVIKRRGKLSFLRDGLASAAQITSTVFMIVIGALLFTLFINLSGLPTLVARWVVELPIPNAACLLVILLVYIPLGMFLDATAMLFVTVPVFQPVISAMGYDSIWFGIVTIKMIEIGLITPPVGINVLTIKSIAPDIDTNVAFGSIIWFLAMDLLTVAILIAVPQISLFLPQHMKG